MLVRLLYLIGAAVVAITVPLLCRLFTGVCSIFGPYTTPLPNPLLLRLRSCKLSVANKFVALLTCDSSLFKAYVVWAGSLGPTLNFDLGGDFALILMTVGVVVVGELLAGLLKEMGRLGEWQFLFSLSCLCLYCMLDW